MFFSEDEPLSQSIVDAIRSGDWSFEPDPVDEDTFKSTRALPGTGEKVDEIARRVSQGLPLWHSDDRRTWDPKDVPQRQRGSNR